MSQDWNQKQQHQELLAEGSLKHTRRRDPKHEIFIALCKGPKTLPGLARELTLSQSTVKKYLRQLGAICTDHTGEWGGRLWQLPS